MRWLQVQPVDGEHSLRPQAAALEELRAERLRLHDPSVRRRDPTGAEGPSRA